MFIECDVTVVTMCSQAGFTTTEISSGEFSCLTRNSKMLFVSKPKSLDQICLINHGDEVLSPRYFFQRKITERIQCPFVGRKEH